MRPRRCVFLLAFLILISTSALAAGDGQSEPDRVPVMDGHVRHDLGDLHNHATNWGLIGSRPGTTTPFAEAPSARWPGADGLDHLFSAGLWVGAVRLGETLVTTASFTSELRPTEAPGDTIQTAYHRMPGGQRYPWPGADDDGDGLEDEDPLNDRDDDGDGLVDEDCAAIGDQHFFATMADTAAALRELLPDHTPLGIEVLQQSFQWSDPLLAGVIGYDFTITNVDLVALENVYCGVFSDFDINGADDDLADSYDALVRVHDGSYVPVNLGYMRDGSGSPQGGWIGWSMFGMEIDPHADDGTDLWSAHGFQVFTGQQPFEQGGDPTNDAERYAALADGSWDQPVHLPADRRVLMSIGPLERLEPGESVTVRCGLVVGIDRSAMLLAAGEMRVLANGHTFDRDDDPANGEEFAVRWLRPDRIPVSTNIPRLRAGATGDGVHLRCERRGTAGMLAVERRAGREVTWRRWSGWDGRSTLVDADPEGWPRTYDLFSRAGDGSEKIVDSVEVASVPTADLRVVAGPNPFNPRLNIEYYLPATGNARLTVHSVRGALVRVLHDGPTAAGAGSAAWNGEDQSGRSQASGVYLVRLATAQRVVEQRVTLVR